MTEIVTACGVEYVYVQEQVFEVVEVAEQGEKGDKGDSNLSPLVVSSTNGYIESNTQSLYAMPIQFDFGGVISFNVNSVLVQV